jgi:uncharacterized Zn ribbon protein
MKKLSKAEAGKLGAEKSKITAGLALKERIAAYDAVKNPCKNCSNHISYEKRGNKFCSKSCAATFNNQNRLRKNIKREVAKDPNKKVKVVRGVVTWECISCGQNHTTQYSRVGKFCNTTCQHDYRYKQEIANWANKKPSGGNIRKYLKITHGDCCHECGISEWNNKPITLELEHKDGNSENNNEDNLCLICPNCHSQTSTYKGKNKGNGRHKRMVRYYEGKSF